MKWLPCLMLLLTSCAARVSPELSPLNPRKSELIAAMDLKLAQAALERDQTNGWLTPNDCDGMIWSGKYASVNCTEVNIEAAENPQGSGRFERRPGGCWHPDSPDNDSETTWSRDMAVAGLYPYILRCKRLDLMERHIGYGEAHTWSMGDPLADGRAIYTPQMIGLTYAIRQALGGNGHAMTKSPKIWPKGLDDYEAHLQVMAIWLESRMGEISSVMRDRLFEQADREPDNPLYSFMAGRYLGNQDRTLDLLLDSSMPMSEYVRCGVDGEKCKLAEWLFVASLLKEELP